MQKKLEMLYNLVMGPRSPGIFGQPGDFLTEILLVHPAKKPFPLVCLSSCKVINKKIDKV